MIYHRRNHDWTVTVTFTLVGYDDTFLTGPQSGYKDAFLVGVGAPVQKGLITCSNPRIKRNGSAGLESQSPGTGSGDLSQRVGGHREVSIKRPFSLGPPRLSLPPGNSFQGKRVRWQARSPAGPSRWPRGCPSCPLNSLVAPRHGLHKQAGKASQRNLGAQMEQFVF